MFDEKPTEPKEVADIFAGVDKTLEAAAPASPSTGGSVNSAPAAEPSFAPPPSNHGMLMKVLIIGGIVLALAVVGLILYKFVFSGGNPGGLVEPVGMVAPEINFDEEVATGAPAEAAPEEMLEPMAEVDSDSDGLTDDLEKALGTNILKMDTDDDLLSDYDEVKIYETDPLNMDTDGDSYKDGEEVSKGYNPKGSGKLLNFDEAINGVK